MTWGFYCKNGDGNLTENRDTGLCASCGNAQRKAERNALKPAKKPKAIPNRSDKKKKADREYNKGVDNWFDENPLCKARLEGCTGKTDDRHHVSGRGLKTNDRTTWLPVCRNCHQRIHNVLSAKERRSKGLLKD